MRRSSSHRVVSRVNLGPFYGRLPADPMRVKFRQLLFYHLLKLSYWFEVNVNLHVTFLTHQQLF